MVLIVYIIELQYHNMDNVEREEMVVVREEERKREKDAVSSLIYQLPD